VRGAYFSARTGHAPCSATSPSYPEVAYIVVSDARTTARPRAFRWDEWRTNFVELTSN